MTTPLTTGTYLDRILANTIDEVASRKRATPLSELEARITRLPAPVPFVEALRGPSVGVIAEIKRASPSKGLIAGQIDVREVAAEYLDGGASAISVLTDRQFFQGSLDDLAAAASAAHGRPEPAPVLRKDFIVDSYQLYEARAADADAILLIVAALDDAALADLHACARDLGLGVLVEVHDEDELARALEIGPEVVGINNRDLRTFDVDLAVSERLATAIPDGIVSVGESGIHTVNDLERLGRAGVDAVLVGESLMRQQDRAGAVRTLLGR